MCSHSKVDLCFEGPLWACYRQNFHMLTISKHQTVDFVPTTMERIAQMVLAFAPRAHQNVGTLPNTIERIAQLV